MPEVHDVTGWRVCVFLQEWLSQLVSEFINNLDEENKQQHIDKASKVLFMLSLGV